jgi:DNA-binding IclR family transcriptional regulator
MAKRKAKSLPPLTPRAREVVNHVVNTVALGDHDNDGEIGAIAARIGMTPARLQTTLRKLAEQGYVTIKSDFVYPTVAALRWQNPAMDEKEAAKVLRALR